MLQNVSFLKYVLLSYLTVSNASTHVCVSDTVMFSMCVYIQFNKGRGKLCRGLEYKQREIPENKEKEQVVFQQSDKKKK